MARTKNRGYQQTLTPTYTARLWKMGGYIRLSREDLQKINRGLDDSNSVKNQRDILNDFHFNHAEEFESYTEYVDDGHTGTDTERESFQRLLGDSVKDTRVLGPPQRAQKNSPAKPRVFQGTFKLWREANSP